MIDYLVIGLAGKAQCGKSTSMMVIKDVVEQYYPEYEVVHTPFAGPLKSVAEELFFWEGDKNLHFPSDTKGLSIEELQTPIPDKGRQLLINIGQKMRAIRPTVWADYTYSYIQHQIEEGIADKKIYIVDDMRFKNELNVLDRFGSRFLKFRVTRDEALNIDDISEKDLDDIDSWDCVVGNNSSIEALTGIWEGILKQEMDKLRDKAEV